MRECTSQEDIFLASRLYRRKIIYLEIGRGERERKYNSNLSMSKMKTSYTITYIILTPF
jgi:hypothetical protein